MMQQNWHESATKRTDKYKSPETERFQQAHSICGRAGRSEPTRVVLLLFRIELFNQTEPTGVTQMKQELRQIYDSLASGKLSQKEALEKIKAIKLQEQSSRFNALLATPVWRDCSVESSADASVFAERHIVLCELPNANVEKL